MGFITIPSQFQKVSTQGDRVLRCVFDTQEIPEEHSSFLVQLGLKKDFCIIGVSREERFTFDNVDVPEYTNKHNIKKTPSQRLREQIWLHWDNNISKKTYPDFDDYYELVIEGLINKFKDKLN